MDNFLENLKKSLDNGEFNSEISKKMSELNELAETKAKSTSVNDLKKSVMNAANKNGIKSVTENEAVQINQEYEKKLEEIKLSDAINKDIALLINFNNTINNTIEDMFIHINHLEEKYSKHFENKESIIDDLSKIIADTKENFKSNIN